MKKVMVASLLSAVAFTCVAPTANVAFAQAAAAPAAAAGQVQLSPAEYKAYTDATALTDPKAKAAALEAYLTAYPQSQVKADVLGQLMLTYSTIDPAQTINAADRLLQIDPTNLRALTFEVYFRKAQADQVADAAAKQAPLDQAADFAQKGIAASATPPKGVSDADFKAVKDNAMPIFYSAIGAAALNKKDYPGAIAAFTSELQAVPVAKTTEPGPVLMDTFFLGQAYYASTPSDLVKCTFFTTRAAAYAPDAFKVQLQPTASYCYKKYHGNADGYDAVVTAAKANLFPPADFTIVPAPKASDIAHQTVASTPDLATLALSDKEFILQNGTPEDADKVFATIKGKAFQIPGATVADGSTESSLKLLVSDDAVQSKTPDFTVTMKEPLKAAPAAGTKMDVSGTYASYTQTPLMITMTDGEEVKKAAPKKAAPVHHAPVRKK